MSENYDYFRRRLPNKTYISRKFPETASDEDSRSLRIAYKVFDTDGGISLIRRLGETIIQKSPAERNQIKATFYEDDRSLSRLTIQKFIRKGTSPQELYFSFGPAEILRLFRFIQSLQKVPLLDGQTMSVTDDELEKILLSSDQVRRLVSENQPLVLEMLRSEITPSDIVALSYRKKQLDRFHKLLFDPAYFKEQASDLNKTEEALWQAFFEENKWVFGYGLTYLFLSSLDGSKLEQTVAGSDIWGKGKRADALMKTRGAIEALCFVEIKKHTTSLLKSAQYRSECWVPSDELAGGVAQSQITVANTLKRVVEKFETTDEDGNLTGEQVFSYQPRSFLVVGSLSEFQSSNGTNSKKYRSFELYRRNTARPEIITFDELYERARFIVASEEQA
ncbi:Shedu immune nuclease family protein [Tunturiibacter gelidoferens]|uniref:Shedu protein SduA C-terminal domain-containing protein n=1 Tax=Tunturiibacter lichenicola TaxID=2051959 RepID=A0A7Y9NLH5_9BACT|nr:Shedu immune nuclease family protein [Edaphobacter lichenicola]NYF51427.1 hypothetical protein [Edaphobacter lichenicola]